ncbi:hypothetical protein E2C01_049156 [Portunus trituberculatus]|uniref:Uncharacterized protein n=1 Tax=Portunus trituberculatus TaxID=210409 RepID=A0A5B7GFA3_PORTR|nr:hypothetical protein [Portunus trituberculatus]
MLHPRHTHHLPTNNLTDTAQCSIVFLHIRPADIRLPLSPASSVPTPPTIRFGMDAPPRCYRHLRLATFSAVSHRHHHRH